MEELNELVIETKRKELELARGKYLKRKKHADEYIRKAHNAESDAKKAANKVYSLLEEIAKLSIGVEISELEAKQLMERTYFEVDKQSAVVSKANYNKMICAVSGEVRNKSYGYTGIMLMMQYIVENKTFKVAKDTPWLYDEWRNIVLKELTKYRNEPAVAVRVPGSLETEALSNAKSVGIISPRLYNVLARWVCVKDRTCKNSSETMRRVAKLIMETKEPVHIDGVGITMREQFMSTREYMVKYINENQIA